MSWIASGSESCSSRSSRTRNDSPFDEWHHVVQESGCFSGVVQGEDVGVLKAGCDSDLAEESVGTDRSGELGAEHLYGDGPVVPGIIGQVYGGHAALADQALDGIAPFERSAQLVERIGH